MMYECYRVLADIEGKVRDEIIRQGGSVRFVDASELEYCDMEDGYVQPVYKNAMIYQRHDTDIIDEVKVDKEGNLCVHVLELAYRSDGGRWEVLSATEFHPGCYLEWAPTLIQIALALKV